MSPFLLLGFSTPLSSCTFRGGYQHIWVEERTQSHGGMSETFTGAKWLPRLGPREYGECFHILSIDGGGVRGIIPALILSEVEKRVRRPISRLFDLMVGTSTGAIIAMGLSKPHSEDPEQPAYSAQDLVRLYESDAETIFPPTTWIVDKVKDAQAIVSPKYSERGAEDVFMRYFGDTYLHEALTRVRIPSYEIEERRHLFFTSYGQYSRYRMRDVARAATAAPTYFRPARIWVNYATARLEKKGYLAVVDGGVFANNPTSFAIAEANYAPEDVLVVSLGTGEPSRSIQYETAKDWGLWSWSKALVDIVFSDPGIDAELKNTFPPQSYFRFQVQLDPLNEDLDNADSLNIKRLKAQTEELLREREQEISLLVDLLTLKRPPEDYCLKKRRS